MPANKAFSRQTYALPAIALIAGFGLIAGCNNASVDAAAQKPVPPSPSPGAQVETVRAPDGGIQPQAVMDGKGRVHLIYFKGEAMNGDLYYASRGPGEDSFSKPIQVNSQPKSAIATGTIRGGQIALGKDDRVHVAWNGSGAAKPRLPEDGSPMLYTRMKADGSGFEPERNLMKQTRHLDGGGTVTADALDNVYVAWHGNALNTEGEVARKLWVARSTDGGATFAAEIPAFNDDIGACACCNVRAFTSTDGTLYLLYRSATKSVDRDIYLLTSMDHGKSFNASKVQGWNINACPMSSQSFAEAKGQIYGAWETKGQVSFGKVDKNARAIRRPVSAPGAGENRKHPALAVNSTGDVLLAWTEGTAWQRGGDLVWQVYDRTGKPTTVKGRIKGGIPVWGLPTAVARPDGNFILFH